VRERELEFYASPAAMTELPQHPALDEIPKDLGVLRRSVQGLLVHRDWAAAYGLAGETVRLDEQHLRSTKEVLGRAFEICSKPITVTRQPADRVVGICRHFTLLHTAFLRDQGVPTRDRCGFANYSSSSDGAVFVTSSASRTSRRSFSSSRASTRRRPRVTSAVLVAKVTASEPARGRRPAATPQLLAGDAPEAFS
jgi:hypothetical protein